MDETKIKINQIWYQNNRRGQTIRIIRILARHPDKAIIYGQSYTQWIFKDVGGLKAYTEKIKRDIGKKSERDIIRHFQFFGTYKEFLKKKEEQRK